MANLNNKDDRPDDIVEETAVGETTADETAVEELDDAFVGDVDDTDDALAGAAVADDVSDEELPSLPIDVAEDEKAAQLSENVTKKEHSKTVAALVVCICVIGVFLIVGGAWLGWNWMKSSGFFERREVAATVGTENVSALEYRFYYESTINSFYNQNYNYLSYIGIDFSKPLNEQEQSEGVTWADYFKQQTDDSVQELIALYSEAKSKGRTLSDEDKQEIDNYIQMIEDEAASLGKSGQTYLEETYGKGMSPAMLREIAERNYLAIAYYDEVMNSFEYTDDDYEQYVQDHMSEFEMVTFRVQNFGHTHAEDVEETDDEHAQQSAEDKTKADEMLSRITDEDSFNLLAQEYAPEEEKMSYEDADYTLAKDYYAEYLPEYLVDYLFDDARQYGDKAVIEESDGSWSVIYFVSRGRSDYNYVAVRHILIESAATSSDDEDTIEQANAAALKQAEELLAQWKAGVATEDSFAALATEYSADGGSAINGGLYDHLDMGRTVEPFEAWSFDPARKPGDTGIVQTVYGYHIMYFVETQEPAWQIQAKNGLQQQNYTEFYDGLVERFPYARVESVVANIY